MVILKAKNLTRGDVHRLLGLEPRLNGSFTPLLSLMALSDNEVQELLKLVIEGDELYTKVNRNQPPADSQGWTIVLMERASRARLTQCRNMV